MRRQNNPGTPRDPFRRSIFSILRSVLMIFTGTSDSIVGNFNWDLFRTTEENDEGIIHTYNSKFLAWAFGLLLRFRCLSRLITVASTFLPSYLRIYVSPCPRISSAIALDKAASFFRSSRIWFIFGKCNADLDLLNSVYNCYCECDVMLYTWQGWMEKNIYVSWWLIVSNNYHLVYKNTDYVWQIYS